MSPQPTDIVDRLRDVTSFAEWAEARVLAHDAADEIARLRERVAELGAALEFIADEKGFCGWCARPCEGDGPGHTPSDCDQTGTGLSP